MPHGDFSDLGALALIVGGLQQIFAPEFCFRSNGPLQGFFESHSPETLLLTNVMGGFMLVIGCMLFTVRWNTMNGKLSGIACIGCAVNIAMTVFNGLDSGVFVPRLFYVYVAVMAISGLHLMFNANPMIKAASDSKSK